ncbi:hypothetical protein K523DRAFT_318801, partial [Schizophyllum commune Tattone D]
MREAVVPISVVDSYPGGVVGYWHARIGECTALAYMALDHVAAPATSVDAERIFSDGRRQISFMQHRMSHDTFKSSMALASWDKAPFFDFEDGV